VDTDALIASLVGDLKPVRRLRPPAMRLVTWLAVALPVMAMVVLSMGLRPDLTEKFADPNFLGQELAAVATAVVAGWVALGAGVPGFPRRLLLIPAAPLALWIATLGHQCIEEWLRLGLDGMEFHPDPKCIPGLILVGAAPAIAMAVMIRSGAQFQATAAIFWGTLAAASLAAAGLRLFHAEDAALMVVVWQFGSVVLFTTVLTLVQRALGPTLVHAA